MNFSHEILYIIHFSLKEIEWILQQLKARQMQGNRNCNHLFILNKYLSYNIEKCTVGILIVIDYISTDQKLISFTSTKSHMDVSVCFYLHLLYCFFPSEHGDT